MQTVLKTVLKVADMSLDEKTNTLVVRGTPDTIAVAEKIIAAHDFPDPEVIIEVEVLEVSRERLLNLGVNWPTSFGVATPSAVVTLHDLNHLPLNRLTVTSLSATANAQLQDTDANILAAPKLRTRDNQKAKILIGDKVPVITNTVTPVASGSPVVTGSVQYLDVGIKLEVKPHVYLEGDVGIEMSLEVSNIVKQIPGPNGSLAYQIGTRDAQTNLRLRDGETQILAGLIQDQYNRSSDKVPGLGQFPILGHLFRNDNTDDKKTEIVLSITPHILRAPTVADARQRNVFTGTESAVREAPLRLDPVGSVSGAPSSTTPAPGFVGGGGAGATNQAMPPNPGTTQDPGRSEQAVPPGSRPDPKLPESMNNVLRTPRARAQQPGRVPVQPPVEAPPASPEGAAAPGSDTAPATQGSP
jgi:general secretion pathway protein D